MCVKNVLQVLYRPHEETRFLTYRERKEKIRHFTDVSNTNGDFLRGFLHKGPKCGGKNAEFG